VRKAGKEKVRSPQGGKARNQHGERGADPAKGMGDTLQPRQSAVEEPSSIFVSFVSSW